MAELVEDCPRCSANSITFDLLEYTKFNSRIAREQLYEVFSICRRCYRSTVFTLSVRNEYEQYFSDHGLLKFPETINDMVLIHGYVSIIDRASMMPPEHVPKHIEKVFREGATCLTAHCWNAAGTMFRLCIDLVTKHILPDENVEGLNRDVKRNLFTRLNWLFDNGHLSEGIRELSDCVRNDGNDGAHDGTLEKDDAEDLLDFTLILLERIYTEPERVRLANERREQRRNQK